ncbi:putative Flagellar motor switch protein FliG [uncultured Desulfatiglans sp.]|nr:putative Flagellar motor switch protein FliG [uncultured Desulfatiglans sp.]
MNPRHLPGSLKVAILIHSMGHEAARHILDSLQAQERELVKQHLDQMGAIAPEVVDRVAEEFAEMLSRIQPSAPPSLGLRGMDRQADVVEDPRLPNLRAVECLGSEVVSDLLKDEHPQTIAIVLSHITTELASSVMQHLPDETRREVALRIAGTEKFLAAMVNEIDQILGEIMQSKDSGTSRNVSGVDRLAEMLNLMEGSLSEALISNIEESDPDLAAAIKQKMFVFEDLVLVDDRGLQKLLRRIESKELAVALKAASEAVKDKIFNNMSERAGEMVREDIEALGPVRMKEVENAQQTITKIIQELEEKGELVISGRRGEKIVG